MLIASTVEGLIASTVEGLIASTVQSLMASTAQRLIAMVPRQLGTPKKFGVVQIINRFYLFFIYLFVPFFFVI